MKNEETFHHAFHARRVSSFCDFHSFSKIDFTVCFVLLNCPNVIES
jgi:hypothetical protein